MKVRAPFIQHGRIAQTLLSFGGIQAAQMLLPLIALPYLARVLGPDVFGVLMYMLTISVIFCALQEWGFTLGAARSLAIARGNAARTAEILTGTLAGKGLLACGAMCLAVVLFPFLAQAKEYPAMYALAVIYGVVWGLNPTWFFQGTGTGMRRMAVCDVTANAIALGLTFIIVKSPEGAPLYLLLLLVCRGGAYVLLLQHAYTQFSEMPRLTLRAGLTALRDNTDLFLTRFASMAHMQLSLLILGQLVSPHYFGMLAVADKIARAVVGLSDPVTRTIFPEVCALRGKNPRKAVKMQLISLIATMGGMAAAAAVLYGFAPWIVGVFLGRGYGEAATLVRILCLCIPILGCNMVMGTQILVTYGLEQ